MPLLQDDLNQEAVRQASPDQRSSPIPIHIQQASHLNRRVSEESIRTELCEGPVADSPRPLQALSPERNNDYAHATSDRAELIERLKRGESPTWIPNRRLESLFHGENGVRSLPRSPKPPSDTSPILLPAARIDRTSSRDEAGDKNQDLQQNAADRCEEDTDDRMQTGLDIERPRSALHSGDFTQNHARNAQRGSGGELGHSRAASHAFLATSPPRHYSNFAFERRRIPIPGHENRPPSGTSSLSSSLSSSFVYKPPTSPLVQSEVSEDVDLSSPMKSIEITAGTPRSARRHTLTSSNSSPLVHSAAAQHAIPLRREATLPYQAHQPRRSLTSAQAFSLTDSAPQTPAFLRSRRPSFSSEISPIQHASMVGSYEESILRGRMSTTPSRPLDFLAQIGVLGLGKCKASLRCPSHVTLPFSAVFYSYSSTPHGRTKEDDGPSPYVGQVDLENGLPNPEDEQRARRKMQSRYSDRRSTGGDMDLDQDEPGLDGSDPDSSKHRLPYKPKRRSRSPKAPPGGSYRIPEKGQLQVVIKNQNKTAVKLFLIPYDLTGMEAGTKTFIRQRSYSAGPIIDNVPTPTTATAKGAQAAIADRPVLRYLVHLHICCPSKGRFYLYKGIRVVFANRVPDGKEKLRNEVTFPEPRFSPYKPVRVMHPPVSAPSISGPAALLAVDKAFRRRSSGFSFAAAPYYLSSPFGGQSYGERFTGGGSNLPVEPIPFRLPLPRARVQSDGSDRSLLPASTAATTAAMTLEQALSPQSSQTTSRPTTQDSNLGDNGDMRMTAFSQDGNGATSMQQLLHYRQSGGVYDKLSKGDAGYGGTNGAGGVAEGLLSQRLRSLEVQRETPGGQGETQE